MTIGFTAGIAIINFASQLRELFGLSLDGPEPGALWHKLPALAAAAGSVNPAALGIAGLTIAAILGLKRWRPHWPGYLIAITAASLAAALFSLPVETIGTRFGGIPASLPAPHLPEITYQRIQAVLPDALAFTLLGAIESLLSAVVADGMTGRRHRSNCELVAQGFANIASALFGGICVTGTIACTATNVRAGAHGPVSGMLHAVFLLVFMLAAAPLASFIPLAALAGVLAIVAYNMIEKPAIAILFRSSRGDALVLAVTFLLVVFRDLSEGIVAGFVLGAMLFIDRMSKSVAIEARARPIVAKGVADSRNGGRTAYDAEAASDPDTVIYHISGAFFFGAAASVGAVLDRIADQRKNFVLDCSQVPFIDSTAANMLQGAAWKAARTGGRFIIAGATPPTRHMLYTHGLKAPYAEYVPDVEEAMAMLHGTGDPA